MRNFKFLPIFFALILITFTSTVKAANLDENYKLEKVLILSRHNLRAPLVTKNSALNEITPHNWFDWQVNAGELSLNGALLETSIGQYFRLYFVNQGFFTENYVPKENEFRFYANSFQRTIATAKYFSAGMLPAANVNVEYKFNVNESDPIFLAASVKDFNENYFSRLNDEKEKSGGEKLLAKKLSNYAVTTEKILDFKNSNYAKQNGVTKFSSEDFKIGENPYVEGNLRLAMHSSDAILMQYYEDKNSADSIFGKKVSETDLKNIANTSYFGVNLIFEWNTWATAHINPMLKLIRDELNENNRKFTFLCGHDTTIAMVLSALDVEDYTLPESIESKTPIGAKLLIEKLIGNDGREYARVNLVYQTTKQIKNVETLDLDNPPIFFPLKFKNLKTNAEGLYLYDEFEEHLNKAISEYDLFF
ncbi:MAG: histidine-type phosphatase [Selenomonadaceae bacterium]|nr:histidine-type phosphatase [Selenomonadaceae bacterium]